MDIRNMIEFDPIHESLEQRLAEAETYFKILTKQVKVRNTHTFCRIDYQVLP